jgi:hypothetical protein
VASCRNPKGQSDASRPLPVQVAYPLRPKLEMLFHSACESVDRAKQLTFPAPSCFVVSARTRAVHKMGGCPLPRRPKLVQSASAGGKRILVADHCAES